MNNQSCPNNDKIEIAEAVNKNGFLGRENKQNKFDSVSFTLNKANFLVKQLTIKDAAILQQLYEQCHDFAQLTSGTTFSATTAQTEFNDLPPGKTPEDIFVWGLFDSIQTIIGTIIAVRHYSDESTWWIGTMMLAPNQRGKGIGTDFYRAFASWLSQQGLKQISLCVIEANQTGLKFWQKMGFKIIRITAPKPYGSKTHRVFVLSHKIN